MFVRSCEAGRRAVALDVSYSECPSMDLSTSCGFANALFFLSKLAPGSGHLTAPVCSTFVFMRAPQDDSQEESKHQTQTHS